MSVYETYKKQAQATPVAVPQATPQQEGIIKRAARKVLPQTLENKIVGPQIMVAPAPVVKPVGVYNQFKAQTGATSGVYDRFKEATTPKEDLGSLSAKYESNGDPGAVSSGKGDLGGVSYGTHQLTTNNVGKFLDASGYRKQFGNLKPGTKEFNDRWKGLAKEQPEQFKQAQEKYIRDTHFNPQSQMLKALGVPLEKYSETLEQVIYSTSVQHGPNNDVVKKAMAKVGPNASEEEVIKAIYEERWAGGKRFAGSSEQVKKSVFKRFFGKDGELQTALKKLKNNAKESFAKRDNLKININLPTKDIFKKPSKEENQKMIEDLPIMKALNTPEAKKIISEVANKTDDGGLKLISAVESLGTDKTFREAYNSWKKKSQDPDNNEFEKFLYSLQSAAPQSAIGVALSFIPRGGAPLSYAYWTALSADEQIKKDGKVTSPGNIAIDVAGDRLLGSSLESILRSGAKTFISTTLKSFGIEGGTEVGQTVLKMANDYQNATTPEERKVAIDTFKDYIKSGDILRELAVGGASGTLISAGGYVANKSVSQGQNQVNVESQGTPPKATGGVYDRFLKKTGATPTQPTPEVKTIVQEQKKEEPTTPEELEQSQDNRAGVPMESVKAPRITPKPVKKEAIAEVDEKIGQMKETIDTYSRGERPIKDLEEFAISRSEGGFTLPDVVTIPEHLRNLSREELRRRDKKAYFSKYADEIVKEYGFESAEEAREVFEQRSDLNQELKALEKERSELKKDTDYTPDQLEKINTAIQRVSNSIEVLTPAANPVKSGGVERTSAAFKRVQERYAEIATLDATYNKVNLADDTAKAIKFVQSYKDRARRVAMGIETAPDGVTETAVSIAYAEEMRDKGNWQEYADAERSRSLRQTRRGQEIAAERGRANENSPDFFIQKVIKSRLELAGKRLFAGLKSLTQGEAESYSKRATEQLSKQTKSLKRKLDSKKLSIAEAQSVLDSLIC